jgi:hypothetical protein
MRIAPDTSPVLAPPPFISSAIYSGDRNDPADATVAARGGLCHKRRPMTLHLLKLSVGSDSLETLRHWQDERARTHPPLRHRTRHFPRRAAEILDGGSIYWVINRVVAARQLLLNIVEAAAEDGTKCTDLILHPRLVPVEGRLMKPFQGWRYLESADAPPDVSRTPRAASDLPDALRRDLIALALL